MPNRYLIDESLIVYLDRQEYEYHSQLTRFLEDGRVGRSVSNRRNIFFFARLAKFRMGAFSLFKGVVVMKRHLYAVDVVKALDKAKNRADIARNYSRSFLRYPIVKMLFGKRKLMNAFIYANENKTREIQRIYGRKMRPDEVIPLEVCKVAIIAKINGLKIVSFNEDFKYLCMFPGSSTPFIQYIHPDEILKEYRG